MVPSSVYGTQEDFSISSTISGFSIRIVSFEKCGNRPMLTDQALVAHQPMKIHREQGERMEFSTYWSKAKAPQNVADLTVWSNLALAPPPPSLSRCSLISMAIRTD
jgi:hypothetical protein